MNQAAFPVRILVGSLLAAGLAGCGGEEEGAAQGPPPAAIATPAQVRAHLTFLVSQVPIPRPEPAAAQPLYVPAPFTCTASGTREVSAASRTSPYAATPLPTERVRFDDCVRNDGPPGDPSSAFTRRHGIEESGRGNLPDGSTVTFVGAGAAATAPLLQQVRADTAGGVYEEDHFRYARIDARERTLLFGVFREVEATQHVEHELSIRYPDGARFEGSFRFGRADAPFTISSRNDATQLAGEYQIETAHCHTGAMQVRTTRELEYDARTGRFTAGRLEFSSGDGTAVAIFTRRGTVRLVGAGGEELTEPWAAAISPWDSECFAAVEP